MVVGAIREDFYAQTEALCEPPYQETHLKGCGEVLAGQSGQEVGLRKCRGDPKVCSTTEGKGVRQPAAEDRTADVVKVVAHHPVPLIDL